jgi:uncharacterized membrane protein
MKGVSRNIIVTVVVLVAVLVGGAAGWYWVASQLGEQQARLDEAAANIDHLKRKTYSPVRANLDALKENSEQLRAVLDDFKGELEARDQVFDAVRRHADGGAQPGLEPDEWKKMYGGIRDRLTKEAAAAKVAIPEDYDFAFSAYRLSLPADSLTLPLGVQLLGVERISEILIGAKVRAIPAIQRADIDTGSGKDGTDPIAARVLNGPNNLYQVYPFSVSFACQPAVLFEVLNRFGDADLLLVIRDLEIENERQTVPQASQVRDSLKSSGEAANQAAKLVIPVLGQELVQVNLRVDLLYLTLKAPGGAQQAKARPNSK